MAEKTEYIERGAALLAITGQPSELHYPGWYKGNIESIPAADVAPVIHARWIDSKYGNVNCGYCGTRRRAPKCDDEDRFFCGHCGAKMDGGKHETD